MTAFPKAVEDAINSFSKLPGIGRKTAQRLVKYMLKMGERDVLTFSESVAHLKTDVAFCPKCFHIMEKESEMCTICSDTSRDQSMICVVADFIDVFALEQAMYYKGLYHVLHGILSPVDGIGVADLTMMPLFERLGAEDVKELILATNPTMEGEATAMYIKKNIPLREDLTVTRLAKGMPVGSNIDYADELTLTNALSKRVSF